MHNFKKLKIWNESMELVSESYKSTRSFPKFETYGLMNQMNRCAVSIPSNISEEKFKELEQKIKQIQKMISSFKSGLKLS
ncbi:MAG: four helix bundle protein [Algicola sp.]|nr:four helix bundle protein [Algicola sp.]